MSIRTRSGQKRPDLIVVHVSRSHSGHGSNGSNLSHGRSNERPNWTRGRRDTEFLPHDGVEAVDRVCHVVDYPPASVGLDEGVGTPDNVTVALLVLVLDVTGHRVLDVVREAVLRVRVYSRRIDSRRIFQGNGRGYDGRRQSYGQASQQAYQLKGRRRWVLLLN